MNSKSLFPVFVLLLAFGHSIAQAPNIEWIREYAGPAGGFDSANDCISDNSGNLYVIGSTSNGNNDDLLLIKYNASTGDTIWSRIFNGPANGDDLAGRAVLDDSGNLFVAGSSFNGNNDDFLLIKYNTSTGDTIWTRTFNGLSNGFDRASDCTLDSSGNLYVAGISHNGSNKDYLTVKYNAATGDTIWTRRFDGHANARDEAYGCSTDSANNLFVTGYSHNGTDFNLLTIKYSTSGDSIWTRKTNNSLDSLSNAYADCIVDASGDLFIVGMLGIQANWQNRYSMAIKYDGSGNTIWTNVYDGPTVYDQPLGCALDALGDLYVSGTSYNDANDDFFIMKYKSSNGNMLWTTRYNGPTNGGDYAIGCALDGNGNLYVTGMTQKSGGDFDWLTMRLQSTATAVSEAYEGAPFTFSLGQNYPNPFNPSTYIFFTVPQASEVRLTIHNVRGRRIRTLSNEKVAAGTYPFMWDGKDDYGRPVSSGIYLYKLQAGEFTQIRKMTLLK